MPIYVWLGPPQWHQQKSTAETTNFACPKMKAVVDVIKLFFGGNLENLDFPLNPKQQE